jgi:flagellar assembly factor FliW
MIASRTMTDVTDVGSALVSRPVRFVEPLPGFDGIDSYTLSAIDEAGLLYAMRSVDDPDLRFVLAPPEAFFTDYQPQLDDEVGAALGAEEVELLVMVTVTSGLADATANLRAPIVFAPATGSALQVVLGDESLSMRCPLLPS